METTTRIATTCSLPVSLPCSLSSSSSPAKNNDAQLVPSFCLICAPFNYCPFLLYFLLLSSKKTTQCSPCRYSLVYSICSTIYPPRFLRRLSVIPSQPSKFHLVCQDAAMLWQERKRQEERTTYQHFPRHECK